MGITNLKKGHLRYANNLEHLRITGTPISYIPANFLAAAPKLEELYLSKNQITSIGEGAFTSSTLRTLNLSENNLESLNQRMFLGAESLEYIGLHENSIQSFGVETFHFPNLIDIDLSDNDFEALPDHLFQDAPNLISVTLQNNKLENIMSVVEQIPKLSFLDLSGNQQLKENILLQVGRLTSLTDLFLDNTNLALPEDEAKAKDIQSDTLSTLMLCNNKLRDSRLLTKLKGFKNLEELYIGNNEFTGLTNFDKIKSKDFFPKFKTINGENNPWQDKFKKRSQEQCEKKEIKCTF